MKKLVASVFLLNVCLGVPAQNLVPNYSFESYNTCPNNYSQFSYVNTWVQPTTGTSDYFNACYTNVVWTIGIPDNHFGSQPARTGNAYAGIIPLDHQAGSLDYREYLQVQLTSALTGGQQYSVEFYVSAGDENYWDADPLALYFSNSAISRADNKAFNYMCTCYTPQIQNTSGIITDDVNWVKISGTYTAAGGERYITIGVFEEYANVSWVVTGGLNNYGYYFVDDVCVTPVGGTGCTGALPVSLRDFRGHLSEEGIVLEWETSSEKNNDRFIIERSGGGIDFMPVGTLKGSGNTPYGHSYSFTDAVPEYGINYYRLKQMDYNGEFNYYQSIAVRSNSIKSSLYPNPASGDLNGEFTLSKEGSVTAMVSDVMGYPVLTEKMKGTPGRNKFTLDVSSLLPGMYFLSLSDGGMRKQMNFIKK